MRTTIRPLVVALSVLVATIWVGAGGAGATTSAPSDAQPPASPTGVVPAQGSFTVELADEPPQVRPLIGGLCELRVNGSLTFTGTLEGVATGTTTAVVFASCDQVTQAPLGTYADVFRAEADFTGTVAGRPVSADLTYAGVSAAGGDIRGAIVLEGEARGALAVEARLADQGAYAGLISS